MFGFGKKKKQDKPVKKQGHLDKILMGVIVGGAIGSVLGVGLAPKKGSETRKDIGKKANEILSSAREVINEHAHKSKEVKSSRSHAVKSLPEE
jgi:gas vesicle protein